MEWLAKGWDQGHYVAACLGVVAGVALVLLESSGMAEVAAVLAGVVLRYAIWQVPPPGRSKAVGTPPGAWSRLLQVAVVALGVTLVAEVIAAPLY